MPNIVFPITGKQDRPSSSLCRAANEPGYAELNIACPSPGAVGQRRAAADRPVGQRGLMKMQCPCRGRAGDRS